MTNLIKAQDAYIKFLEAEINRTASYLFIHNCECDEAIYQEGIKLRAAIETAQKDMLPCT